jgi:hypothetical protein
MDMSDEMMRRMEKTKMLRRAQRNRDKSNKKKNYYTFLNKKVGNDHSNIFTLFFFVSEYCLSPQDIALLSVRGGTIFL